MGTPREGKGASSSNHSACVAGEVEGLMCAIAGTHWLEAAQAVEVEEFDKAEEVYELQKLAEDLAHARNVFVAQNFVVVTQQVCGRITPMC